MLTESWLNDAVFDRECFDYRYDVFRRDRYTTHSKKRDGGGVIIAVLKKHKASRKMEFQSHNEDIWILLKISNKNFAICAAYVPPPPSTAGLESLLDNISNIIHNRLPRDTSTLVLGDFNLGNIGWSIDPDTNGIFLSSLPTDCFISNIFIDSLAYNNLFQCNPVCNVGNRILDLVLSNSPESVVVSEPDQPLVGIDPYHPPLLVSWKVSSSKNMKPKRSSYLNFFACDYNSIRNELLNVDWSQLCSAALGVDETVDLFYGILFRTIHKHTPSSYTRDNKYPVWYSRPLIKALKEKAKYHNKFNKYCNPVDQVTYGMLRERCDIMIKECYKNFKKKALDHLHLNPKYFWKFSKHRKSNASTIPHKMFLGNSSVVGGQAICNLFSKHFQSIYCTHNRPDLNKCKISAYRHSLSLSNIVVSEDEVFKYLKCLDVDKGPGPDLIPSLFLRSCAEVLYKPLCITYNKSLQCGVFPAKWKIAHITPIHKSGCLDDIANYRPISILSTIGKILESLIQKKIYSHVKALIDTNQHGFMPHKSTSSNLVAFVSDLSNVLDGAGEVHSIYTDFKKAFDLVHHDILLYKMEQMGIHGSLLRWCESYVRNRSQLVAVYGFRSELNLVPSGVPQGSHLGPLFFLMFINDIAFLLCSKFKMYADDLKLYRAIYSLKDALLLQEDLNRLYRWCYDNCMVLNTSKCYHIKFTRRQKPLLITYFINNTPLTEITSIRDLGVVMDATLSFRNHFDSIISKASRLTGFVSRQMKIFNEPEISILIYNSLIRSILEYCSTVWNPGYQVHSDRIERVQKRFLYHLTYNNFKCKQLLSYESRLSHFNMSSLHKRRKSLDLMFLFKVIHGIIDAPDILESLYISVPRPGSRLINRKTFSLPICRTNLGQHSPVYRMCSCYNGVRCDFDIFSGSVASARNSIRKCIG